MRIFLLAPIYLLTICLICLSSVGKAAEPTASPGQLLERFAQDWRKSDWIAKSKFRPRGYMRPLEDSGWRSRMQAIQSLVLHGSGSIEPLLDALKSKNESVRILSAQTLGYLADIPRDPLLEAARNDPSEAVRLYAVDALGMQGHTDDIDWQALRKVEKNRDVRKHIGYAIERGKAGLEPSVVDSLRKWNFQSIDSAVVGNKAPDFSLSSATGQQVQLSDYQGKKNVVLIFIYGDT